MSPSHPGAPGHASPSRGARPALGAAQIAGICLFPVLGAMLVAVAGIPVNDTLLLLAGCGAIGAATITAASGTRRLLGALAGAAADPSPGGNMQGPGLDAADGR
ncbi:hypothetical protein ACIQ7Q_34260 [Streptomyces sp. NPDC096176]|uniref:hypothetical protein n=1 Tax=Streptomyces sp. NPDC096176 TaxID=3366079 RepID=UPI00380C3530